MKPELVGEGNSIRMPAAFRRLCVETRDGRNERNRLFQPPSGGCVLKHELIVIDGNKEASRLQAAVC